MVEDERISLLNELQGLLEGQAELARQGRLTEIGILCERADVVVEEIARLGILKLDEFSRQRKHLAKLYEGLRLTLSDQQDKVGRQLNKIRKGRKTIGAYKASI